MIRAEHLQIGDYVKYTNPSYIQVASITKKKIGYHIEPNESRMHYVRLCEVEPIPHTTEILEKNGIVLTDDYNDEGDNHPVFKRWMYSEGRMYISIVPDVYQMEVYNGNIARTINFYTDADTIFVHQLQHVLRLCGIEKEIEL